MNFAPYHRFRQASRLEKLVETLRKGGNVSDEVYSSYSRYHFALLQKLWSAKRYVDNLERYVTSENALEAGPEMFYTVNFFLDGFLNCIASSQDIFAREVLGYFGESLPDRVYYSTARELISRRNPSEPILPLLEDPSWRLEFSEYRNVSTHEMIISDRADIVIEKAGHAEQRRLDVPLPDDPRAEDRTYRRRRRAEEYCAATFRRAVSHYNCAYRHLCDRIHAANHLPI